MEMRYKPLETTTPSWALPSQTTEWSSWGGTLGRWTVLILRPETEKISSVTSVSTGKVKEIVRVLLPVALGLKLFLLK